MVTAAATATALNGHHDSTTPPRRPLLPGIYAPIPTFFLDSPSDSSKDSDERLDIPSFQKHILHIASSGVGPLLCGSMGEAHHLLPSERLTLIKSARQALDSASLHHVPLIVGTGAGSLKETIILTNAAHEAGADYGIVICSGYFAGALANDREALEAFWLEVAKRSRMPILVYNYPGAAGGIDLDSDLIISLAKSSSNIIGVKLTCGNVGKLTRIASVVSSPQFLKSHPRLSPPSPSQQFLVLGGFTDFLVPSAFADGHGAITGLANVAPYACVKLFELTERLKSSLRSPSSPSSTPPPDPTLLNQIIHLQGIIAQADRTLALGSISGTKYVLEKLYGYGGKPRKPLPAIGKEKGEKLWCEETVRALVEEEKKAVREAKVEKVNVNVNGSA